MNANSLFYWLHANLFLRTHFQIYCHNKTRRMYAVRQPPSCSPSRPDSHSLHRIKVSNRSFAQEKASFQLAVRREHSLDNATHCWNITRLIYFQFDFSFYNRFSEINAQRWLNRRNARQKATVEESNLAFWTVEMFKKWGEKKLSPLTRWVNE